MVYTETFTRPSAESDKYCRGGSLGAEMVGSRFLSRIEYCLQHMYCTWGAPVQGRLVRNLCLGPRRGVGAWLLQLCLIQQGLLVLCDKLIMSMLAGRHVLEV